MRVWFPILLSALLTLPAVAGHGVALLVGEGDDLRPLATALEKRSYRTTVRDDLGAEDLAHAIEHFLKTIPTHGVGLLYLKSSGGQGLPVGAERVLGLAAEESAAALALIVLEVPEPRILDAREGPEHILPLRVKPGFAGRFEKEIAASESLAEAALAASGDDAQISAREVDSTGHPVAAVSPPHKIIDGIDAGDEWVNAHGMVFCWCPANPSGDGGFWLGKYELTKRAFDLLTMKKPRNALATSPAHPRDRMRYPDILQFLEQLNIRERFAERLPDNWEYGLPTDAEWEYACRAGTKTPYSFGTSPDDLPKHANFADRSLLETGDDHHLYADRQLKDGSARMAIVGRYAPNPWGFHDMHGNLWEWTATRKDGQPVACGGSWVSLPDYCRSEFRRPFDPETEQSFIGFRVILRKPRQDPP